MVTVLEQEQLVLRQQLGLNLKDRLSNYMPGNNLERRRGGKGAENKVLRQDNKRCDANRAHHQSLLRNCE
ncbi:hypothetical protein MHYP_G00253840 [Metynnis hypsauchen]